MNQLEELHYLLGYLEGLKAKQRIDPSDLELVQDIISKNYLFLDFDEESDDHYGSDNNYSDDNERESYGEFAGTYAQDVEGLSDNFINDVLDGDPDNYWNID